MSRPLVGRVAVVTGGSRGVGKGAALGLAEAGATVYVTGRTLETATTAVPGTLTQTVQEIAHPGGRGIAVRCDHRNDDEVKAVFQRIADEQGRLDILVNNAFGFPEGGMPVSVPFWELPPTLWDEMHAVGLRSHYVASVFAAPHMVAQRTGLIVNISSVGAIRYLMNVVYGVGKAGVDRLAADMAHELRPYNIAAVSLWPGPVKTERVIALSAQSDLSPSVWKPKLPGRESPQLTGRVVAALAADPHVMDKTGWPLTVAELTAEYGVTDLDGTSPPLLPEVAQLRALRERRN